MINGLFGRPRAGKSYEAVRYHIIPALVSGRMVVTNIPLNVDKIAQIYGEEVRNLIVIVKANFTEYGSVRPFSVPKDYEQYEWRNEQGVGPLFIVDEAHLSVGRDCKAHVREYYSMHGHYGHDIILVTQSPNKIHKDVKDMVEVSWRCVKMSVYGQDDAYIKKTYHGVTSRNADFVHEEERAYDKQFFPFYKSHTQSKTAVTDAIAKAIKAELFPHKKKIIGAFVFCLLLAVFAGYGAISSTGIDESSVDTNVKKSASQVPLDRGVTTNQLQQLPPPVLKSSSKPKKSPNQLLMEERKRRSNEDHPFAKVDLHVVGHADYQSDGRTINEVYFEATKKNRFIFDLKLGDLYKAGYDIQVLSECVVKLTYFDFEDYIICDAPPRHQDKQSEGKQNKSLLASNG